MVAAYSSMHLCALVLLTLFLRGTPRRNLRIYHARNDAQQHNKVLTKTFNVTAATREALLPGGSRKALLPRLGPQASVVKVAHGQVPRWSDPHGQPPPRRLRGPGAWRASGPRRAAVALQGVGPDGKQEEAIPSTTGVPIDLAYPGTAVARMLASRNRVRSLKPDELSGDWESVRKKLLWAAGLRDLPNAVPGQGYTGHAFNDDNHCDATTMLGAVANNLNQEGPSRVAGIAIGNSLGNGIKIASLPELGEGGSWSTCTNGCHLDPPQDVAHVQFRSRIAFKLVWCPPDFSTFVLVDDEGALLASGTPSGALPQFFYRTRNFNLVNGSKYAKEAERIGSQI